MSQENVEIVRRFLAAELEEGLAYADPGIVWNPIEEASAQGHDAVRASMARWRAEWDDYELVPRGLRGPGRLRRRDRPAAGARSGQRDRDRRPLPRPVHPRRREDRPHGSVLRGVRGARSRRQSFVVRNP